MYLWEDRAAVESWFTAERVEILTENFVVKSTLTWYDTTVTVDNLTHQTRIDGFAADDAVAAKWHVI